MNVFQMSISISRITMGVSLLLLGCLSCSQNSTDQNQNDKKLNVLLFSKTNAFRHDCIEPGGDALRAYFESHNITATQTEDSSVFNGNGLIAFDVVIFFQTTGNILDSVQQESLEKHVRAGKGFVGIHSAADTEYDWPWYAGLIGAQFASHPDIIQATVMKIDTHHLANKNLPDRWMRTDEWYNFKQVPANATVLLSVDETTYQGGAHGANHPVSWYKTYDGGRSFYTAMGHTVESYQDTLFLGHIFQGVVWAGGK